MTKKQGELLKKIYTSVPVYYRVAQECGFDIIKVVEKNDWSKIPVLEKDKIISEETSTLTAEGTILQIRNELLHVRTSGVTGKYMDIYWKLEDYNKSMLPLWYYRYRYYGIWPEDKCCFFYTIWETEQENARFYYENNTLGFSKSYVSRKDLKDVLEKMKEFQPKWLMLQPSIAVLLCNCMDFYNIQAIESIKYIEFTGEILTQEIRKMAEQHFNCKIADQYGANEFNSIAYECPYGNMHIMSQNVLVEILKKGELVRKGQEGELHITSKTNRVMPLIRYRIGDTGRIIPDKMCNCGNPAPVLKLTSGRTSDFIQCPDGERISIYSLVRGVDRINGLNEGIIKQFQFVQVSSDHLHVKLVMEDVDEGEYDLEREEMICEQFLESVEDVHLKEMQYSFEFLDELFPEGETGKFRYFIKVF